MFHDGESLGTISSAYLLFDEFLEKVQVARYDQSFQELAYQLSHEWHVGEDPSQVSRKI